MVARPPAPRPRRKPRVVSISKVKAQYRGGQITRFEYKRQVDALKFQRKKRLQAEVHRFRIQRDQFKMRYRRGAISKPQLKMMERRAKDRHKMRLRQIKFSYE